MNKASSWDLMLGISPDHLLYLLHSNGSSSYWGSIGHYIYNLETTGLDVDMIFDLYDTPIPLHKDHFLPETGKFISLPSFYLLLQRGLIRLWQAQKQQLRGEEDPIFQQPGLTFYNEPSEHAEPLRQWNLHRWWWSPARDGATNQCLWPINPKDYLSAKSTLPRQPEHPRLRTQAWRTLRMAWPSAAETPMGSEAWDFSYLPPDRAFTLEERIGWWLHQPPRWDLGWGIPTEESFHFLRAFCQQVRQGHSMGGALARAVAEVAPDAVLAWRKGEALESHRWGPYFAPEGPLHLLFEVLILAAQWPPDRWQTLEHPPADLGFIRELRRLCDLHHWWASPVEDPLLLTATENLPPALLDPQRHPDWPVPTKAAWCFLDEGPHFQAWRHFLDHPPFPELLGPDPE